MTLIDTAAWIEFFRPKGDPWLKALVLELMTIQEATYTCPVAFELTCGARKEELDNLANWLRTGQSDRVAAGALGFGRLVERSAGSQRHSPSCFRLAHRYPRASRENAISCKGSAFRNNLRILHAGTENPRSKLTKLALRRLMNFEEEPRMNADLKKASDFKFHPCSSAVLGHSFQSNIL